MTVTKTVYQLQWRHNAQWRYEDDGRGTFATLEEAEFAASSPEYDGVQDSLRIVKIGPKSFRVVAKCSKVVQR